MNRDILKLAWPVFVGQVAVMLNGVIDTMMAGRLSAVDVAAVGLGASIYICVYVGLMGVLLALAPIAAQHWGAGRHDRIREAAGQAIWLALALALPGCLALGWTEPWLAFAQAPDEVAAVARGYLVAVAAGLPAALLFRVFYALSNAIARPGTVMAINVAAVAAKLPLNALFMQGWQTDAGTTIVPALGGAGAGVATAIVLWLSLALSIVALRAMPVYRALRIRWPIRPDTAQLRELLRFGLPIGGAYLVEVTSFAFMALFLARLGATVAASHQIAANLAALAYMVPLALANATSTMVAQSIGAGRPDRARDYGRRGLRLAIAIACAVSAALWLGREGIVRAYTTDAAVIAAALPLVALVAAFHLFDAIQATATFVLRAHRITTLPMLVYLVCLWGIGLGGGWWLAFVAGAGDSPLAQAVAGAKGFWIAAGASLLAASALLAAIVGRVWKECEAPAPGAAPPLQTGGGRPLAAAPSPGSPDITRNRSR
ncbi:MATE family efflux transporter [Burkholderiaceae bacterium FT117]|uniref:MATE family efflux transporter n=1 Tax=Zeimonas sediminis TaxID=2944268 RepID=UPI0023430025|nr:MATE family efflux transporter [Zeimonas sediminis]MCM5569804.1 MATE family efflux transporter [Zeimonas sediminis]